MSEKSTITELNFIDGYKFLVKSDVDYIPDFYVDEAKPEGEGSGPNPPRLLATAVGHCLSSSLIYCLKKARISIKKIQTTVKTNLYRNEKGYLRIQGIEVTINLQINEEDKNHISRCLTLFEDYCTVTQSVRKGIEVDINIK